MTGNSVALDTNQAVHVLNDVPEVVAWLNSFDQLLLPVTVVGELLYGAMNSAKAADNVARVDALLTRCGVLENTVATSRIYAALRRDLRQRGRPVPENDLWIAAACVERGLPLATDDAHFSVFGALTVLRLP
jgi:tRNA(fMet)-specific endonuclease VapC